jgi:hypothetical protein
MIKSLKGKNPNTNLHKILNLLRRIKKDCNVRFHKFDAITIDKFMGSLTDNFQLIFEIEEIETVKALISILNLEKETIIDTPVKNYNLMNEKIKTEFVSELRMNLESIFPPSNNTEN